MMKMRNNKKKRYIILAIAILFVIGGCYLLYPSELGEYMKYSQFATAVEQGMVESAEIADNNVEFYLKDQKQKYYTDNPGYNRFKEFLLLNNVDVAQSARADDILYTCMDLMFNVVFIAIIGGVIYALIIRNKKQFPLVKHGKDRFTDIAGMNQLKMDMQQLVEIMKKPDEYAKKGMRLPHGILFVGPPGNGKTMFARALAGEANVNFIATKATDFQSMYMSIGPAKVKALFRKARKHAPCIVFIDEFDGIGEKRNYAGQAIDKENNRIITAMLNELDGFERNETGVVVIAATNNVKDLDPALIRAGRFDRKYMIGNPDLTTRTQLIQMYLKNKTLDSTVSLEKLAAKFDHLSCAQIEAIINEACLIADTQNSNLITTQHMKDALERVLIS